MTTKPSAKFMDTLRDALMKRTKEDLLKILEDMWIGFGWTEFAGTFHADSFKRYTRTELVDEILTGDPVSDLLSFLAERGIRAFPRTCKDCGCEVKGDEGSSVMVDGEPIDMCAGCGDTAK